MIHQLSMQRKHFMFRRNDYAVSQRKGSIILCPLSETGQHHELHQPKGVNKNTITFNEIQNTRILMHIIIK
ncbi:hypothetical protein C3454_00120 [Citrobacter europaeus]|nr:hypothetical protein MC47_024895 [Citrobacter freundii]ROW37811.1 hypothetical protein C3454_00120 [Citrobacter europaeus]